MNNQMMLDGSKSYTGRQLYDVAMVSTLNKKPVELLKTAVMSTLNLPAGSKIGSPKLKDVLEYLLVEGSFIIYNGGFVEGEIEYLSTTEAVVERDKELYTHMIRVGSSVYITDFVRYDEEKVEMNGLPIEGLDGQIGETIVVPGELVVFFPNEKGILEPVQKTLLRIEEIYQTLGRTTPLEALIFVTNMSGSVDKLNATISEKITADKPVAPLSAGCVMQQPDFSNLTTRLFNELNTLEPAYMEATYSYKTFPQESGVARKFSMQRFTSKVTELQAQCMDIYNQLGVIISFKPLDITETEEDQTQIAGLYEAVDRGVMSLEEASPIIRKLLGLEK